MRKYFYVLFYLLVLAAVITPYFVQADALPAGNPVTFDFIDHLASYLLGFIMGLAAALMVISITVSGIMITVSRGDSKRFESGLQMLKTSIYGSAVVLGSGVILSTIMALVDRSFFCQLSLLGICLIP